MLKKDSFWQARQDMVERQMKSRGIKDERVLGAFRKIRRHEFIPEDLWAEAYADYPLPIGYEQTISQPYIVALMTEQLDLKGDEKALEIGTGSGYQAAILSELVGEVHSVERIPELADYARGNLKRVGIKNVRVHVGDGTLGWVQNSPYDAILVTAGTPTISDQLVGQLREGGRLVAPVGGRWRQMLVLWAKNGGKIEKTEVLPVVFVPLIGKQGWNEENIDS